MVVKDKLSKIGTPSAVCNLVRENEVTYGVHMHRTAAFEPEDNYGIPSDPDTLGHIPDHLYDLSALGGTHEDTGEGNVAEQRHGHVQDAL